MAMHPSITVDRILEVIEESVMDLSSPGICTDCGEDAEGVEPDAENYMCEACGKYGVFGAEQLLLEVA